MLDEIHSKLNLSANTPKKFIIISEGQRNLKICKNLHKVCNIFCYQISGHIFAYFLISCREILSLVFLVSGASYEASYEILFALVLFDSPLSLRAKSYKTDTKEVSYEATLTRKTRLQSMKI
mgnify:CR=1 FL=1